MRALNMFRLVMVALLSSAWGGKAQTEQHPQIATGLWEIAVTSQMSGAGLPSGMGSHTTKIHSCATRQNIDQMFADAQQQRASCVKSNERTTANGMSMDISCSNGAMTGHVDVVFDSDSSAHSTMHGTMEMRGSTIQIDSSTTAKRLGSDCGSVKPDDPQVVR